jgi:signal transduction histidine kinase
LDRLFLRVFLKLFGCMLLAILLLRVFVIPRVDARVVRNLENTVGPQAALVAELLTGQHAQRHETDALLERVSKRIGTPLVLLPRSELQLESRALGRVDGGEAVLVWRGQFEGPMFFFARVPETDQILRLGPIEAGHPWGGKSGWALGLLMIGGLSLGVYLLVRPIRQRLAELARTAHALGRGELGARVEPRGRDEISALAEAFNQMAEEIQRLISAREELLRMTSHELRTPIQRMHFSLDRLHESAHSEQALDSLERDLTELDELIEELLTYVRLREHGAPVRVRVEVLPVLDELCKTQGELAAGISLTTHHAGETPVAVTADARLFRRAVSNLIVNALRHARSRVQVTLESKEQVLCIHVDDDGPGIPVADHERIFEPFQRLDDERTRSSRGSGLGLAIVRRIAEVHGGHIAVLTSSLGGARFQLSLPHLPTCITARYS